MKKIITLLLALIMCACVLVACDEPADDGSANGGSTDGGNTNGGNANGGVSLEDILNSFEQNEDAFSSMTVSAEGNLKMNILGMQMDAPFAMLMKTAPEAYYTEMSMTVLGTQTNTLEIYTDGYYYLSDGMDKIKEAMTYEEYLARSEEESEGDTDSAGLSALLPFCTLKEEGGKYYFVMEYDAQTASEEAQAAINAALDMSTEGGEGSINSFSCRLELSQDVVPQSGEVTIDVSVISQGMSMNAVLELDLVFSDFGTTEIAPPADADSYTEIVE